MSIDLNAIQDDDEISKVTLAHEIERTRQQFHACDGEIYTQMEAVLIKSQIMIDKAIEQNGVYMQELDKSFKESLSASKKELELSVNKYLNQFVVILNDYKKTNDLKFSGLEKIVETKTEKEVSKYLNNIYLTVKNIEAGVESFKKDMRSIMSTYQTETMAKVKELDNKFESTRSKFSVIAESLKK